MTIFMPTDFSKSCKFVVLLFVGRMMGLFKKVLHLKLFLVLGVLLYIRIALRRAFNMNCLG